jgi:hypothetical protein
VRPPPSDAAGLAAAAELLNWEVEVEVLHDLYRRFATQPGDAPTREAARPVNRAGLSS